MSVVLYAEYDVPWRLAQSAADVGPLFAGSRDERRRPDPQMGDMGPLKQGRLASIIHVNADERRAEGGGARGPGPY